ncbi:YybH family protein [Rufibacter latericius]|uniref:SgcJ/EcaC family oxidoreductase n=1 Tax=Rufibacter latericius TaxID=2487040 RepID=A0A3M9MA98_9BACT|nr:SgcJ/EcaC family oxidoreductase [Rufibacter latericius]RNI21783.1 SgcJ/EcaC family oxidoreductase [Rufibacter latericius]
MEALSVDITDEIKRLCSKFTDIYNSGDATALAALYTPNAVLMPAGFETAQGREAIAQFWKGAMEAGIKSIILDTIEVENLEQTAIELGHYTLKGEDGQAIDKGKYMVVWKRDNGDWKLQKDIWNSNQRSS